MSSDFDADNGRTAKQNREQSSDREQTARSATPEGESAPHYPTALLSDSRFAGRGNAPVQQSIMQNMQKTQGNRAVQRSVQRSASTPVQRVISTNGAGIEEMLGIVAQGGGNFSDNIVAQGGGNYDNIVAQGGGNFDDNIVAQGGGNFMDEIVAQGGGN